MKLKSETQTILAPAQGVKLRGGKGGEGKVLKNHENSQISMFKVIKVGDIT